MYVLREVCHTEFHRLPEEIKNIIFFSSLFTFVVGGVFLWFFLNQFSVISIVVITIIIIIIVNIIVIIVFIMIAIIYCFGIRRKLSIVGFLLLFCSLFFLKCTNWQFIMVIKC